MNTTSNEVLLSVSDLKKRFGDFTAVDNLNFEIYKNEIFGLLGPNGAGKTTTINMICGLLPPTSGTIVLKGQKDNSKLKHLLGYCPQDNIFYPKLSCLEQLLFIGNMYNLSTKSIKPRALELLDILGLSDKTHSKAGSLSGGMKRRLNICLALINNPELLILDEPEAGLDPQSRILVRDFIKKISKEKTVVLTTHNMDEADRLTDRIAIIDYGKLLLVNSPENLKKTIGDGDILEIQMENNDENSINKFNTKILALISNTKKNNNSFFIKHTNIIEYLPKIKSIADSTGLKILEFKLRENTLEDVFIHLTGRSLRE